MLKCSFCGKDYDEHKGLTYILKDGTIKHFCSSKCRKNYLMKRRKVRWVPGFKSLRRNKKKK